MVQEANFQLGLFNMYLIMSAELATWQRCAEAARPALPGAGQRWFV